MAIDVQTTTTYTYTCDRCDTVETGPVPPGSDTLQSNARGQLWLCANCTTDFGTWLTTPPPEPDPEPTPDPGPVPEVTS